MNKKNKKFMACRGTERLLLGLLIALVAVLPPAAFGFCWLFHHGVWERVLFAFTLVCAVGLPVIVVLMLLLMLSYSQTVVFERGGMVFSASVLSRKKQTVPYEDISEAVVCNGVWRRGGAEYRGREIFLLYEGKIFKRMELSWKIVLALLEHAGGVVRFVGDGKHLKTPNAFYGVDFAALSAAQKKLLVRRYCRLRRKGEEDGARLLNEKGLL